MFLVHSFPGIPMGRSAGRTHDFSSCSALGNGFGVRNGSPAIGLPERYHFGGGRYGSHRSQSLQNLRSNPMFGDYQSFGGRAVRESRGNFGGENYGGANQHRGTHLRGCTGGFSGDSYHRSGLGGGSGSSGGGKIDRAVGSGHHRCLGVVGRIKDCNGGKSVEKSGGLGGESNGERRNCGDGETYSRRDRDEKCQNNYVDLGAHGRRSDGESLESPLRRRGSLCDIGQGRNLRVRINGGLQNPEQVGPEPEIQRVQMEEGEQMKNLNRQCASCINKIHILEQEKTMLSMQWEFLQQQNLERGSLQNTESLFQSYMQDMRMLLNTVRGQKGQLLAEHEQLQGVTEEYEKRYQDEIKKRTAAQNEFARLKKDIDCAYTENMNLDVKTDLLIEQMVRLRGIYDVERIELQTRVHNGTNDIFFMDNHRDVNIDNFLEEVRCQYEKIAQRSKEEVDARCRAKYEELHSMCGIHYEHLHNSHQEIQELTHCIRTRKMEVENLKKKNTRMQETIADSEQRGDRALQDAKEKLRDLEHELQKARNHLTQLLQNFREQLNAKVALDIETSICRKQLERGHCRQNQVNSIRTSAGVKCGGESGGPSGVRNKRDSSGLCSSGGDPGVSGMGYGSKGQGSSSRRGSYTLGDTTCSRNGRYSTGNEGCHSKGTNSPMSRECDPKGTGISATEKWSSYRDASSAISGRYGSRDISGEEEGLKCQTDDKNRGFSGGLADSKHERNSEDGKRGFRNLSNSGEGVHGPNACESGGHTFGISPERSRHGSGGNAGLRSGGYASNEGAEPGTNTYSSRSRPAYEGGRDESIPPPEYRYEGYGYENSRSTNTLGNREFGSRDVSSSGRIGSPLAFESVRCGSESRLSPGRSRYGSGVEGGFGKDGYGCRDGPTYDSGRNGSILPPEYRSCYEGERSSGNRELGPRGIFGSGVSNLWSSENGKNGSGSGVGGSGLRGATGGTGGSGSEEFGSRSMDNPGGGVSSPTVYRTRGYSSGGWISPRI